MRQRSSKAQRQRRGVAQLLCLLVVAAASIGFPSHTRAGDASVGFDDLSPGTTVGGQYAAQGVNFVTSGPVSQSPTLPVVAASAIAPSPPNAASLRQQGCGGEFCQNFAMAKFSSPRTHVSVMVADATAASTVYLTAYNEVGPVPDPAGAVSVHSNSTAFQTISVSSSAGDIVYVAIQGADGSRTLIDNLTFDVAATPPPASGSLPPGSSSAPATSTPLPAVCGISRPSNVPISLAQTGTTSFPLVVRRSSVWHGDLYIRAGALPAGIAVGFDPATVNGPGTDNITATVTTSATSVAGDIAIVIQGATVDTSNSGCSVPVTITVRGVYSLVVNGFELNQGVQTEHLPQRIGAEPSIAYSGVLLPAGKKTVVRVFASSPTGPPGGIPSVDATLSGYAAGSTKPLPGSPLHPQWGRGTVRVAAPLDVDDERKDPSAGFAFVLPPAWTTGDLELQASVSGESGFFAGAELCTSDDCKALQTLRMTGIHFIPMLDVHIVPIAMTDGAKTLPSPSYTCYGSWETTGIFSTPKDAYTCPNDGVFSEARQFTPVGDGQFQLPGYNAYIDIHDLVTRKFDATDSGNDQTIRGVEVNWRLWKYANAHEDALMTTEEYDPRASNIIVGVVPADAGIHTRARGADCRDSSGFAECDYWRVASVPASGRPIDGVAHEVFHMYGRYHASSCITTSSGPVGNYDDWPPDQQGFLQGYGMDTRDGSGAPTSTYREIGVDVATDRPHHKVDTTAFYDFMGYCDNGHDWVSVPNWNATVHEFANENISPTLTASRVAGPPTTLAVSAYADPRVGAFFGTVGPSGRYRAAAAGSDAAYHLIARDQSGAQLGDTPMTARASHVDHGAMGTELVAVVPSRNVARLDIVKGGDVLATRSTSGPPPSVRLTAPLAGERVDAQPLRVSWSTTAGKVEEHGALRGAVQREASLDYSIDDGHTWRTIYAGPDTGSATIPAKLLAGADKAKLRITVNDGFREADAVSEVFSSAGADPDVQIISPTNDLRIVSNTNVYLNAAGNDDRGRRLRDNQLIWYVNDKQVAVGALAGTSNLPTGLVVLKLIGHDDRGRLGGAQLCLLVSHDHVVEAAGKPAACNPGPLSDPQTGRLVGVAVTPPSASGGLLWLMILIALLVISTILAMRMVRRPGGRGQLSA